MLQLNEADVRRLLPMQEAVRLMRETFAALHEGKAQNQPRRRMTLDTGSVLHSLAGAWGNYFGTKIYSTHVKHGAHFFFLLFDAATARPLAMMEANYLGQIRTGAASGYATDLLANPDADVLAVIGSGFQAKSQVEAIACVRQLREVRVFSRKPENREGFATDIRSSLGLNAVAADSAGAAVRGASIIATATWAKDPVIQNAWVADGAHINAMGSNNAQRREIPADLIARASLIAVDAIDQSKIEAGDLLLAWSEEDWKTTRLKELQDVAAADRKSRADVTIFKSNGLGVEDVAAGAFVYEQALREMRGASAGEA